MTDEIKMPKVMSSEMVQTKYMIEMTTLRDQFAMAALTGLISRAPDFMFSDLSQKAYRFADDMLEARKEKK